MELLPFEAVIVLNDIIKVKKLVEHWKRSIREIEQGCLLSYLRWRKNVAFNVNYQKHEGAVLLMSLNDSRRKRGKLLKTEPIGARSLFKANRPIWPSLLVTLPMKIKFTIFTVSHSSGIHTLLVFWCLGMTCLSRKVQT